MTTRLCDVVIATKNRPEPLQRCLRSLARQSVTGFGIIVVDDHSDTPLEAAVAEVARSERFSVEPVVVRLPRPSGPAAARNAGVAASDAEYVVFIDDDVVLDRHLVELHLSEVRSAGPGEPPIVTRGPFVEPSDWHPTAWNLWEARMATRGTNAMVRGDYTPTWRQFHTGNNCMSVDLFRAVGGFDESYQRAEDDELGARLEMHGVRFHFLPSALAYHYPHRSLESWLAIPRAYAHYTVVLDRDYPQLGYLATRKRELAGSNRLLRGARTLFGGTRRTEVVVRLATTFARLTHRARLDPLTLRALSLAYDLNFAGALRAAEAAEVDADQRSA
ncbi:MAG TPA: glycosyltransferase [Ilumatobacter sp.]|nr:glycosyltransferase [Ilumatobacter sp.]